MTCYGIPYDIYWELLSKPTFVPPTGDLGSPPNKNYNAMPVFADPAVGFVNNVDNMGLKITAPNTVPDYYHGIPCNGAGEYLTKNNNFPYWLSTINSMVDLRVTVVKCCADNAANYCAYFNDWPKSGNYLTDTSPVSGVGVAFTT